MSERVNRGEGGKNARMTEKKDTWMNDERKGSKEER